MTELLVCGKLKQCPTYPLDDISPALLETIRPHLVVDASVSQREALSQVYPAMNAANVYYWRELIEPLEQMGRDDLAQVVRRKVAEYEEHRTRVGWRDRLRRWDTLLLGGTLRAVYRSVRRRPGRPGSETDGAL